MPAGGVGETDLGDYTIQITRARTLKRARTLRGRGEADTNKARPTFIRILDKVFKQQGVLGEALELDGYEVFQMQLATDRLFLHILSSPQTEVFVMNINLFNNNLATGGSLTGAILSCHVELSK